MKNTIFVSYSWEDEHWRSEIYRQLNAIIKNTSPDPNIEVWIDEEKLRTGDTIDQKITEAIERTKVAALLISADFLTSDYIRNTELPYLCEKGVRLFPILVEPCPFLSIPWLEKMLLKGARNEKNELIPLSNTRTDPDRKISTVARQILSDAAEEIVEIMRGKSSYDRPDCSQLLNLEAPAAEVPDAPPQDREETAAPSHDPQSSSTDDKGGAIAQGAADHSKLDGYPRRDNRYVEVELTLQHRDIDYYQAELRLTQSDDDNERYPHFIYLDTKALSEQAQDVESYGKTLTESLFPEKSRRASIILEKALLKAKKLDVPVRIRICISPTAMELHAVQWEALKNPLSPTSGWLMDPSADDGKWPAIAFSRHVMGSDQRWREVHLRAKPMGNPRALVVVSVPSDGSLREHGDKLQPIVRRQQENLAVQRLDGLTAEQLSETADRATLDDLVEALSDPQGWDILYLVCHFTIDDRRTMVLLEDRNGDASPVATRDLVDRIGDLRVPPRALVLVSGTCEDAESNRISDQRCGLMKAGAILLQSGIPVALIADGNGPPQQLDAMLPQFLNHLQSENPNSDGRADEALEKARRAVEENHWDPWWTPVLVSRQKTTRTWYSPGFLKVEQSEASWERLLKEIKDKKCTPIIGPGLVQHLVGSRREMAQSWADDHFFPMSYHDRINLPQVAQYLMVNRCDRSPTDLPPECKDVHPQMRTLCAELSRNLRSYIRTRYRNRMPRNTKDWPLSRVFSWAGREEIESNDQEPHRILADLELPLYVTANQNLLLEDALCRHGPELNEVWERLGQDREQPFFYPTQVRNRVHHVFGDMDHIQDIVLTEDDYFEFLMSAFREGGRVPYRIQSTLSRSSLLFLGFRLYHWDFRVLFQFIKEIGGSALLQGRPHVAVQIDPDDDYIVDPERARRYLECYFDEDGTDEKPKPRKPNLQMSIFWGTPVDFLRTLQERR